MKKSLLIIPSWQVWPFHSGGAHAQTAFLKELSEVLNIHMVITPANTNSPDALTNAFSKVTFHKYRFDKKQSQIHQNKLKHFIINLLSKIIHKLSLSNSTNNNNNLPSLENEYYMLNNRLTLWYSEDKEFGDYIKTLDKEYEFDYIQYEMEYALPAFRGYKSPCAKNILVLHEVMSVIVEQYLCHITLPNNQNGKHLLNACQFAEKQTTEQFDKVVVFNTFDKNKLEENLVQTPVFCSPYITKNTEDGIVKVSKRRDLVLVGSGFHAPNFIGTDWFLKEIWPSIYQQIPNINTYITGTWQLNYQHQFSNDKHIIFTGNLPTEKLNELLHQCIMVSPVFIGSGLRTKIIEGLRLGIPMVVHELEKDFMPELENGINTLLAKRPQDYINQILKLNNDPTLLTKLMTNSKIMWNNTFNNNKLLTKRLKIYN